MAITTRDLGRTRIRKQLEELSRTRVLAGVQGREAQARHPNSDESVGTIAKWLHYGTATQPARPFVDRAIAALRGELGEPARTAVREMVGKRYVDVPTAVRPLGEQLVAQIREEIDNSEAWAAPLAPSTIARKGSSQPLVDTGTVRDSVSYAVVRDGAVVGRGRLR